MLLLLHIVQQLFTECTENFFLNLSEEIEDVINACIECQWETVKIAVNTNVLLLCI